MFDEQAIEKFPKLQINNINEKMTRLDIDQRFSKYGKILGINMQASYIQVVYDNEDSVHQAVRHEHLTQLREKRIEVVACLDKGMNRLGINNNMGRGRGGARGGGVVGDRFRESGMGMGRSDQFRDSEPKSRFDDNFGRGGAMSMANGPRGDGEPFAKQSRFDSPREPIIPPRAPDSFNTFMPDSFMGPPKINDCEILVMNKLQQVYAELIEQRLKNIGLSVDLMFMRDELAVMRALNEMAKKGTFYAVVITPENEIRGSLTLNILQGSKPQEHRNMPMDDALKMVARTFAQMRQEKRGLGAATPIDREIHFILNLLMNGKYLTIPELDRVLNYVQDIRDRQAIAENIPLSSNRPTSAINTATAAAADTLNKPASETSTAIDPMVEQQNLQQRILNIISNQNASPLPQTSSSGHNMTSSMPAAVSRNQANTTMSQTSATSQAQSTPSNTYINFDNPSVQKALDSLISSGPNLLKSISMVSGNNSSSGNSQHNSMMPNRMNNSGTQNNNYNGGGGGGGMTQGGMGQGGMGQGGMGQGGMGQSGMNQGGTNQGVNSQNNSSNTFQSGQNMMGSTQPAQNQGYRHPLMGTQIGTPGQGQFFNQRGGSGMRY